MVVGLNRSLPVCLAGLSQLKSVPRLDIGFRSCVVFEREVPSGFGSVNNLTAALMFAGTAHAEASHFFHEGRAF